MEEMHERWVRQLEGENLIFASRRCMPTREASNSKKKKKKSFRNVKNSQEEGRRTCDT
jgi:hypothetical protein